MDFIVDSSSPEGCVGHSSVGGKARNLWLLGGLAGCKVPDWFCVSAEGFDCFLQVRSFF